ncbi:hypothetical protein ACFX58_02225 [Sphingomonas sp. NCPPB 2930]
MDEKKQVYKMNVGTLDEELGRVRHHFGMLMAAMHESSKRGFGIEVTPPADNSNTGTVNTPLGTVTLELGYSHDHQNATGVVKLSHAVTGLRGMERRPIGAFKIHPYTDSHDAEGDHFPSDSHRMLDTTSGGQALVSLMQAQMRAHVKDSETYLGA